MSKNYRIDYTTSTITVSRKFLEEASQLGSAAFDTMNQLRALGMKIEVQPRRERKSKQPRLNYAKMAKYIACVEDSATYLAEFEAVKAAAQGTKNSYALVWKWFRQKFPNYNNVPEFDENLKIVVCPTDYAA